MHILIARNRCRMVLDYSLGRLKARRHGFQSHLNANIIKTIHIMMTCFTFFNMWQTGGRVVVFFYYYWNNIWILMNSLVYLKIWKGPPKAMQVLVQETREIRKVTLEL